MLLASISQASQKLDKLDEAENKIEESLKYLNTKGKINSDEGLQIKILVKRTEGDLFTKEKQEQAISAYEEAYEILEENKEETNPFKENQILTVKDIESVHRGYINLLSKSGDKNKQNEVKKSLKEHYLDELNNLLANKKWEEADIKTHKLMLYVADRESDRFLNINSLKTFSCKSLQDINSLWVKHSDERFGFSVQKQIWVKTGNRLGVIKPSDEDAKNYQLYISHIGWYDSEEKDWKNYPKLIEEVEKDYQQVQVGTLLAFHYASPGITRSVVVNFPFGNLFSRAATCKV